MYVCVCISRVRRNKNMLCHITCFLDVECIWNSPSLLELPTWINTKQNISKQSSGTMSNVSEEV
ncbi:hypothetical protein LguiA_000938 [Lonicera macranthoides]